MHSLIDVIIHAAGYVGAIHFWPMIRFRINGVGAEVGNRGAKAATLVSTLKGR